MGASESTANRVTVTQDESGTIRISESAARQLKSQMDELANPGREESSQKRNSRSSDDDGVYAAPLESLTLRKRHEEEIEKLQASWKHQIQEYEEKNQKLWTSMTTRLSDDLTAIENRYRKSGSRYDPVCPDAEKKVADCYRSNLNQSLKCSSEVKQFLGCVDDIKIKQLKA